MEPLAKKNLPNLITVIPAEAGIQYFQTVADAHWTPASAGVTTFPESADTDLLRFYKEKPYGKNHPFRDLAR